MSYILYYQTGVIKYCKYKINTMLTVIHVLLCFRMKEQVFISLTLIRQGKHEENTSFFKKGEGFFPPPLPPSLPLPSPGGQSTIPLFWPHTQAIGLQD